MAVIFLEPNPQIWVEAMKLRGEHEDHNFAASFREFGNMTPSQARKRIARWMVEIREKLTSFGDRTYACTMAPWAGIGSNQGRAKVSRSTLKGGSSSPSKSNPKVKGGNNAV
jgi:hypothetical protein